MLSKERLCANKVDFSWQAGVFSHRLRWFANLLTFFTEISASLWVPRWGQMWNRQSVTGSPWYSANSVSRIIAVRLWTLSASNLGKGQWVTYFTESWQTERDIHRETHHQFERATELYEEKPCHIQQTYCARRSLDWKRQTVLQGIKRYLLLCFLNFFF